MDKLTREQVLEILTQYRVEAFCEVQIEPNIEKLKWHSGRVSAFDVAIELIEKMEG